MNREVVHIFLNIVRYLTKRMEVSTTNYPYFPKRYSGTLVLKGNHDKEIEEPSRVFDTFKAQERPSPYRVEAMALREIVLDRPKGPITIAWKTK